MEKQEYKTFVGADLHRNFTQFSAQNKAGKEVASKRIDNVGVLFQQFLTGLPQPVQIAVESTGNWAWFCETVKEAGFEAVVAHARDARAKSGSRDKNDRKDARMLATLLRGGLIEKQSYQAPRETLLIRERLRYMHTLTKTIVMHKNRIHSVLMRLNIKSPFRDAFCKKGRIFLRGLELADEYKATIERALTLIENAEAYFADDIEYCRRLAESDVLTQLLASIPGINVRLAPLIRYETGEVERFKRVEAYVNYTGLVPGKEQSADKSRDIGITKEGSFWLRWAFVQAAQTADRQRGRLSRYYWRMVRNTGSPYKARVATAREMACIAYYVMKRRQGYYEPLVVTKQSGKIAS